jgi:hypothetical protein
LPRNQVPLKNEWLKSSSQIKFNPKPRRSYLKNAQTAKFCRLAPMAALAKRRALLVTPASCLTEGVLCDQDTAAGG